MAVGETASRKSTSLPLVKKLLGGTVISQSSGESVMSELVKSSFPVYWDDPTHPNTLRKLGHVLSLPPKKFFPHSGRVKIGGCESGKIRDLFGTLRYYGNACAAQIVSEVSDETVISNEDVDGYLMEKLIPYVSCQYEKTIKVHATLNQLIGDLISTVEKTDTQEQVGSWIKPCVKVRDSALGDAIHILRANLTDFLSKSGTPYSSTNLLQVCRAVNGANADFRSDFGNGKREASIKLPRQALHEDHLKTIDSWFGMHANSSDVVITREQEVCDNCEQLKEELTKRKKQWTEQETPCETAVEALEMRLIEERKKNDDLNREIEIAASKIQNLQEEIQQTSHISRTDVPTVTRSLETITRGTPLPTESKSSCSGSTKRKLAFQERSGDCNLCKSKKMSGMVKCNSSKPMATPKMHWNAIV
ncbi:uncharacterized protein [Montipora capricornis]|uniref:uncharacterized protein n=1 Tax=Montipora capricornis TaxID=246305 RepID=UPI0035F1F053